MLFYLLSKDELRLIFEQLGYRFDPAMIPRNIEYYLKRTSHGSTLSAVTHAWVLARADRTASWRLFQESLDADIADIQGGTTPEGIHTGAMAGSVDIVHRCFTGFEARGGTLHFNPVLPENMRCLRMCVSYRRQRLEVEVTHERLVIRSRPVTALPVMVAYRGHYRRIAPGESHEFRLLDREALEPVSQRSEDTCSTDAGSLMAWGSD
jgi:alpha,alpha-trehalase